MSFGVVAAVAVGVTAGVSIYQGEQQRKAQKQANSQALEASKRQADLADQANNRLNGKRPNMAAISAANAAGRGGAGSTMITGPGGVDPSTLTLGKNTLLGS